MSTLVNDIRMRYYFTHGETTHKREYKFNHLQFIRSITYDMLHSDFSSLPISFFLGSFYYQIVSLPGDKVGFRIDNNTNLESGTHVAGRYPKDGFINSVEELLDKGDINGDDLLYDVINSPYRVLSILEPRTRDDTPNPLGGGTLYQTYTWTEKRDPCPIRNTLSYLPSSKPTDLWWEANIFRWPDYQSFTQPVYESWK